MNMLTKSEKFFNNVKLTADDHLFVGIDVHKRSYHVAFYLNDAPSIDFVMPAKKEQLSQKLKTAMSALRQIAYETGPPVINWLGIYAKKICQCRLHRPPSFPSLPD